MLAGYTQLSATTAPSTSRINTPSAWSKPQHDAVHRKGRTPFERVSGHALRADVRRALGLYGRSVGTGKPRHKRKKAPSFRFRSMVIQLHRQLADWARKALGHVIDAMDRLVRETCRDDSRFIDAGSAVFAGKRMRPGLELPIQDVIETVHGDHPRAHPHTLRCEPRSAPVNGRQNMSCGWSAPLSVD